MKTFVSSLFLKLAKRAGVTVNVEPKFGIVGQIVGKDGKKTYFRNTCFDLNTLGATEIARDKDYASYFLQLMGYPVIPGKAFYDSRWCKIVGSDQDIHAAYTYAKSIGFPVIVKPNSKSQGSGVAKVHNREQFYKAMRSIFRADHVALVQQFMTGNDYRVVVLDGKVISAYQRLPLSVVGNGKLSVRELLEKKQRSFDRNKRDTKIDFLDPRIAEKLKSASLTMESVISNGRKLFLLDNANLSTGGDAFDVTETIHPSFKKIAAKITSDMGLRFCGVDFMIDGTIDNPAATYWVIEINAAPGLDHYFTSGKEQQKIVEDLYLKVLQSMS